MKHRFASWLAQRLQALLAKVLRPYNAIELQNRTEAVGKFVYETLPSVDEDYGEKVVIEGGTYNYFQLPSGAYSRFDFVLPELHIYIVVAGLGSASWEEARSRGVSRSEWEAAQGDLNAYETEMDLLPVAPGTKRPALLLVKWGDSVSQSSLHARLTKLLKEREGAK